MSGAGADSAKRKLDAAAASNTEEEEEEEKQTTESSNKKHRSEPAAAASSSAAHPPAVFHSQSMYAAAAPYEDPQPAQAQFAVELLYDDEDYTPAHAPWSESKVSCRLPRTDALKVPKSPEHWVVVGVFIASRDFPSLPFFVQLIDYDTGRRIDSTVPYKSMMSTLSPMYNDRERVLLHVRVVQQLDQFGMLEGEVRYLCSDIGVDYNMSPLFNWISDHPTMFQVYIRSKRYSSLSRRELQDHLAIASSKGDRLFQSAEAETTRTFLTAVLRGKGLPAECTLETPPPLEPAQAVANGAAAAASSTQPIDPPLSLQSIPDAHSLFTAALAQLSPLWFHPVEQEAELAAHAASSAAGPAQCAAAAAAAPSPESLPTAGLSNCSRRPRWKLLAEVTKEPKRDPLSLSQLPFVQFIALVVPATASTQPLPSVIICNQIKEQVNTSAAIAAHAATTGIHRSKPFKPSKPLKPLRPPPPAEDD